jgi:hypothetical protein
MYGCAARPALTKLSGYAKEIAEFYSLCGNQISAFLGSIGVSLTFNAREFQLLRKRTLSVGI